MDAQDGSIREVSDIITKMYRECIEGQFGTANIEIKSHSELDSLAIDMSNMNIESSDESESDEYE